MRARVLSFDAGFPDGLEQQLNAWLEEAGDIVIENTALDVVPFGLGSKPTLIVFYRERFAQDKLAKTKPVVVCQQCRKNPPANGLKTCEECQEYQKNYRQKRKTESKARYP